MLKLLQLGSVAFIAGKVYLHTPWFSDHVIHFLIRSTVAMLAMILAAVFGMASTFRQCCRERLICWFRQPVYRAVCIHATSNVSVRYLLPMFHSPLIAVAGRMCGVSQAYALG